jgi:hypothetical protein
MDFYRLRQESVAEFCEHGNEPSGFIKIGEFLDFNSFILIILIIGNNTNSVFLSVMWID